jgi:hypothetical protein
MDRADYLTERNQAAAEAWIEKRMFGWQQPDPRTREQRRAWLDAEWRLSQARAWLEVRRREAAAWPRQAARSLCRVIAFPARGLRR